MATSLTLFIEDVTYKHNKYNAAVTLNYDRNLIVTYGIIRYVWQLCDTGKWVELEDHEEVDEGLTKALMFKAENVLDDTSSLDDILVNALAVSRDT